jgi:N-acyl-D-amino-acid deacylase
MMRISNTIQRGLARVLPALCVSASALLITGAAPVRVDVLIAGGTVYTGEEKPGVRGDVGLRGDRIVFVGDSARAGVRAKRRIDASGMIVAPGLIDVHTHSGGDLAADDAKRRQVPNHTLQGVATVFVGNDGDGSPNVAAEARTFASKGIGVNVASFVGFGAVRKQVIGETARAPSPAELVRMQGLVAKGMCEGGLGLSAGLYYAPQSFAKTEEVIALAREAARRGGLYDTHMRDESSDNIGLLAAVEEVMRIGREAGLPVHISHIKAQGIDVHGQSARVIDIVRKAQASGLSVTADQYSWLASGTHVSNALAPRWAMDGGDAALVRNLGDPKLKARLDVEMADNLRRRGGPESILLTSGPHTGQTLGALAKAWNVTPLEAGVRVMRDEGDARIASFNMTAPDMENFARQPWVVSSSDASEGHPRKYGSMPLRWRLLVREGHVLTPQQFIRRSTGLTADIYGLRQRGYLRPGYFADVLVFDPARFRERSDYAHPRQLSEGVQQLFVNGVAVVDRGQPTGALPGRPLLKPRNPKWACPA